MVLKTLVLAALLAAAALQLGCTGTRAETTTAGAESSAAAQEDSDMLAIGTQAPDFEALDDRGQTVRLSELRGRNVVLIFYPMNNTPTCTAQLCAVRDDWALFQKKDIAVFGVNPGSIEAHRKFAEAQRYPFPLLADTEKKIVGDYRCRGLLATKRTVYGIDREGRIVYAERGKPANAEILAAFGE